MIRRLPIAVVTVVASLALVTPSIRATPQNDSTATITAQIVKARDHTTEYVAVAKDTLSSDAPDLLQARKLYSDAYSDYDSWVAYMRTALENGRAKHLGDDADYAKIAADASTAGVAFTKFVDTKTGGTKAANVLLTAIGSLGLQLWNQIADGPKRDRCIAAANFEQMTRWYFWEAITDDTLKNPPAPIPATTSDYCKDFAISNTSGAGNASGDGGSPQAATAKKSQN